MKNSVFLLAESHSGVMQQGCLKYHCIYFLDSFDLNGGPLTEIVSSGHPN